MEYALLGPTGVKVSRICVGTATFGVAPTERDADRVIRAALDLGINFVDTANVYGNTPVFDRPGVPPAAEREPAERILGRAPACLQFGLSIVPFAPLHGGLLAGMQVLEREFIGDVRLRDRGFRKRS